MPGKVTLEVVDGPIQGSLFSFEEHDTFLFGRSRKDCHAHLPDDQLISRHHFILEANPPDVRVRDLGSRNGTYVNGVKYGGRALEESAEEGTRRKHLELDLKHGDIIIAGNTSIRVQVEIPITCDTCGTFIAAAVPGARLQRQDCAECRQKAETIGIPTTVEFARCQECGRDVSSEMGSVRHGDYICKACRQSNASDPMALLHRLMDEAVGKLHVADVPSISGYKIGNKLGEGGMGVVYAAERQADRRSVALKVMLSRVAVDPKSREGFLREVAVTRQLSHSNVVQFLDSGAVGGAFYLVMEFCNGGNIVDQMRKSDGLLSCKVAGPLMLQVLDGLHYAHQRDFVHRDLKPENILLNQADYGWQAKVSDFGLSKNFQKAGFSGMTATGSYAGTYPYMPPEQLTNFRYVRPVSDIWSIGATFYTMLCGQFPRDFPKGVDPMEVILRGEVVPLRVRKPDISTGIAAVIDRSLANEVGDRWQSAVEMQTALRKALAAEGIR